MPIVKYLDPRTARPIGHRCRRSGFGGQSNEAGNSHYLATFRKADMSKRRSGSEAENPPEPRRGGSPHGENGGLGGLARLGTIMWSSRNGPPEGERRCLKSTVGSTSSSSARSESTTLSYWQSPLTRRAHKSLTNAEYRRQGGDIRASLYSPEHFREWGRLGGKATRERHGNEFFREIWKMRKYYPKGYMTRKTKVRIRENAVRQAKTAPNFAIAELWRAVARNWEP
jgi:hypothetical protein